MFLVLAPTVFMGHTDSIGGHEQAVGCPWKDDLYDWDLSDHPAGSNDLNDQIYALCIWQANSIDCSWFGE